MRKLLFILLFYLPMIPISANDLPFQSGEELKFDIHYKYGLVMVKAGSAHFKMVESNYQNKQSYFSILDFRTSSFFDRIFRMRDTLRSNMTENLQPLYHLRSVHEGNYQFAEEMFFNKSTPEYTEVRVRRTYNQQLRFDTVLTTNTASYDLLNLLLFVRTFDFSKMETYSSRKILTFVGREIVTITVRNEGQAVVERSETLKYKTYKVGFDFTDSAFNESKNAIEVWISDDQNRIPIKIRAKLRVGAAEVHLTTAQNLKYPFTSEVKIPVRK